jgi:hypothetical protein
MTFGYIGIDFGTSNSHFAYCLRDGDDKPVTIHLGGKPFVTSCVLWKQPARDEADVLAYGTEALYTWLQTDPDKRDGYHFAFGFKPDLVKSERARRDAWAFLLKARQEAQRSGLPRPIQPGGLAVVVGVPAEIGDEHKRLTRETAHAAGFGEVECVEEPLGALAYHLHKGDITPAEARAGIVVVDFGGGTLDVALVSAAGLHEPWGDPMLGGRLFDDLFFQWLCDQNAPLEVPEREALVVWQKECRELKEAFSGRWQSQGDTMADFTGSVQIDDRIKRLKGASVAEFLERARHYRPSAVARRYFRGLDAVPAGLVLDAPIDLIDRVRTTLTRGEAIGKLRGKFSKVILTGGSSHWPFMKGLVCEAFSVDTGDVIMSQEPETTIGSGLALYNVLKMKNEERRQRLRGHKAAASKAFQEDVAKRIDRFADDTAAAILDALMPRIETIFWDWYKNGGSLQRVEDRVDQECDQFQPESKQIIERQWQVLETDLVRLLRDHLKQFLADNEIPRDVSKYVPESKTLQGLRAGPGATSDEIARQLGDLAAGLTALAAGIVALIIGAIKIKIILVAALAHPVLALAMGVGALVAFLGLGDSVRTAVESRVKAHEFNSVTLRLLKLGLWENSFRAKLAKGREDARAELRTQVRKGCLTIDTKMAETFDAILELVIQDLLVLELIRPVRPS